MNKSRSIFKKSGIYYAMVGSFILTIAVVHFVMQIFFIQKENLRSVETAVEFEPETVPPPLQVIEIAPEQVEVKKVEVIEIPEIAAPVAPRRSKENISSVRKPIKKKAPPRETRSQRLRRAERILTGV